jgi:isopenicillin-N N-acyltransferase like protein
VGAAGPFGRWPGPCRLRAPICDSCRVEIVVAEGPAHARGRQVGRALPEQVARSVAAMHGVRERSGRTPAELAAALAPLVAAAEAALPERMAYVRGLAEGANAPFGDVFAVNALEEVFREERVERCSSLAVASAGGTLLAHNEQWATCELGNCAVVVERAGDGAPWVVSPTVAACLPVVGLNGHGGAFGVDSLVAADDRDGIPRVLAAREVLDARDPDDLLLRARLRGRAGGYGTVAAFPGGRIAVVEQSAERAEPVAGAAAHTNHYLHPELAVLGVPASPTSSSRLAHLARLRAALPAEPEAADLVALLGAHDAAPEPICAHGPDPDDPDGTIILYAFVADCDRRRLWVCEGPPCTGAFEEVDLACLGVPS